MEEDRNRESKRLSRRWKQMEEEEGIGKSIREKRKNSTTYR